MSDQFAKDVKEGLSRPLKALSSKYFYDDKGSLLFSEIMKLPEYYLTDAELEIFQKQGSEIIEKLDLKRDKHFDLIELGAGDGYKTIELLKALDKEKYQYSFIPIDISRKALDQLESNIEQQLPGIVTHPIQGDYFQTLKDLDHSTDQKVVLFLGSNIGNMNDHAAHSFMHELSSSLSSGDKLILGTDLIKSKDIVLPAYNDSQGVTSAFNLNLLERINRELDANFDLSTFEHTAEYEESEGIARSFIISTINQHVFIKALEITIFFQKGERIHTEISRKYNDEILGTICHRTGLKIIGKLLDSRSYFADYILERQAEND